MAREPRIKPYTKAAGGWDSLISSVQHLLRAGNPGRGAKTLLKLNQEEGFDCPGCAWGDPEHTSSFEFCENGVKAVAWESTSKRVTREFFERYTLTDLATWDGHSLEGEGRLSEPMAYNAKADKYEPITWPRAFAVIGRELNKLESPDEAAFYTSGRTSNEAAFLWQLFARAFGTNNLPDCSNMCHEPSGVALNEAIGIGKGTVKLEDFEAADAIFIFGQNPGTNHPRMLGDLQRAATRGCKIVTFNPLKERGLEKFANPKRARDMLPGGGTKISSRIYQLNIGGDRAAVMGMMKHLARWNEKNRDIFDHGFIREHTTGIEALLEVLKKTPWGEIERQSGLNRFQLDEAAKIFRDAKATIFTWAMGITQHQGATGTIQMLANMQLLKGNIGRPGAGLCPVRGHSNVQGDRTMGIDHEPTSAFLGRLDQTLGITAPRTPGLSSVDVIAAMAKGRLKVFIAMGGNFASATPDTALTERGLAKCELSVHVSTKLNRSHIVHGKKALILPALGRTEMDFRKTGVQVISVEDSMSMVHASSGLNMPASKMLKSEVAIVAGIARATLKGTKIPWDKYAGDYSLVRDVIEKVVPGFEAYNERIRQPGGFYLGNSARQRVWNTKSGKAEFKAHPLQKRAAANGKVFTMTTFRSHDQYNTSIYGLNDRYRGVKGGRQVVFVNPGDIKALALQPGDRVDIAHAFDKGQGLLKGFRLVEYDIPAGNVAAYFPEANILVPLSSIDKRSKTPASKSIPVTLKSAS